MTMVWKRLQRLSEVFGSIGEDPERRRIKDTPQGSQGFIESICRNS
jgi:GTP cyclohydrolase I